MDGFAFVHRERVALRDLDAFGHVNNAVYMSYVEQARFAFLAHLGLVDGVEQMTVILARVEMDFRSPAFLGEEIAVGIRPSRLGTKSFELEHELRAGGGRVIGSGRGVLVGYDYARGETTEISDEWRRALSA